jgi:DNA-binding response OmpR family regulator
MPSSKHEIPMLIAQSGPAAGQRWVLAKDRLTLGRGPECDIIIPDRQVSRVHACLSRMEDAFAVEDLGSKNGTHVNGAPIHAPHKLQDGDLIQVALVAKLIYVGSEATMPLRAEGGLPREQAAAGGGLLLDGAARRIWVRGREVDPPLSVPQFRFLELLYQHPDQVISREDVVTTVWPEVLGAGVSEQAIDALVRRLRDRLAELDPEHQYIVTVRGHGFRLENAEK